MLSTNFLPKKAPHVMQYIFIQKAPKLSVKFLLKKAPRLSDEFLQKRPPCYAINFSRISKNIKFSCCSQALLIHWTIISPIENL